MTATVSTIGPYRVIGRHTRNQNSERKQMSLDRMKARTAKLQANPTCLEYRVYVLSAGREVLLESWGRVGGEWVKRETAKQ